MPQWGAMPLSDCDLFVFDLDGTLIDSLDDIAASLNRVRKEYGLPEQSPEVVRELVGRGARWLVEQSIALEASAAPAIDPLLARFLADYSRNATVATRPYPGAERTLAGLRARKKRLAVLSNKPEAISRSILTALGLAHFFGTIAGGDTWAERKPHPRGLLEIARHEGVPIARTALVGDTGIDVATARAAGAMAIGVSFGFRPTETRDAGPDLLIDSLEELVSGGPSPEESSSGA